MCGFLWGKRINSWPAESCSIRIVIMSLTLTHQQVKAQAGPGEATLKIVTKRTMLRYMRAKLCQTVQNICAQWFDVSLCKIVQNCAKYMYNTHVQCMKTTNNTLLYWNDCPICAKPRQAHISPHLVISSCTAIQSSNTQN